MNGRNSRQSTSLRKKVESRFNSRLNRSQGRNHELQAGFWQVSGLTPLCSCANLAALVAGFEPQNPELFHVPYCFSSEYRSATQTVEVAVVDSPEVIPEENSD